MGTIDLNGYRATAPRTPNLDKLAPEGLKLAQFTWSRQSVRPCPAACSPDAPARNGVSRNGCNFYADETTIGEKLKPVDYHSALIGKWRVGMRHEGSNGESFDHHLGHRGGCIKNYQHNTLK